MRRDVAAVGECVHPRPLGHPLRDGEPEQRAQVVEMRVDASPRDEAQQVNLPSALVRPVEGGHEGRVLEERSLFDRPGHPDEVLEEDPPGADRQVADLRVAHLPVGQADGGARGVEPCRRITLAQTVEHRCFRQLDRIAGAGGRDPPSVEDHEGDERDRHVSSAARQMAANESGSSEAPPTSAPPTSGCASSSSAFSGFTEPP